VYTTTTTAQNKENNKLLFELFSRERVREEWPSNFESVRLIHPS